MAKYPILVYGNYGIYGDEAGFAELMPQQEDQMMKAPGPLRRQWSPRSGPILGADALWSQRRPPRAHDAAGARSITDGSFARIKGGDADAPRPGFVPRVRPTIAVVGSRLPDSCG
jgi:hypothetical protein